MKDREWYLNKAISMSVAENGSKIMGAEDAYPLLKPYGFKTQEHFIVMTLTGAHAVISTTVISIGTLNRTLVHPRDIFRKAISDNAAAILVAHNHPSNTMEPSEEDKNVTARLKEARELLGIAVLDHLIVCKSGYFSFQEAGIFI